MCEQLRGSAPQLIRRFWTRTGDRFTGPGSSEATQGVYLVPWEYVCTKEYKLNSLLARLEIWCTTTVVKFGIDCINKHVLGASFRALSAQE